MPCGRALGPLTSRGQDHRPLNGEPAHPRPRYAGSVYPRLTCLFPVSCKPSHRTALHAAHACFMAQSGHTFPSSRSSNAFPRGVSRHQAIVGRQGSREHPWPWGATAQPWRPPQDGQAPRAQHEGQEGVPARDPLRRFCRAAFPGQGAGGQGGLPRPGPALCLQGPAGGLLDSTWLWQLFQLGGGVSVQQAMPWPAGHPTASSHCGHSPGLSAFFSRPWECRDPACWGSAGACLISSTLSPPPPCQPGGSNLPECAIIHSLTPTRSFPEPWETPAGASCGRTGAADRCWVQQTGAGSQPSSHRTPPASECKNPQQGPVPPAQPSRAPLCPGLQLRAPQT